MKTVLESTLKVRFADCDPFRHLNNARYLDYFIMAREDQIEEAYGIHFYRHMQETGKSWVVGSNQIVYLRPAVVLEELRITSELIQYDKKSIRVEMKMWNKDKTELKALLWIRFMYIDIKTQKLTDQEQELMDMYASSYVGTTAKTFEERFDQLMASRVK